MTSRSRAAVRPHVVPPLDPATRDAYRATLLAARSARVPVLLGGAYAFECLTGIAWHTKDLDVFAERSEVPRLRRALEAAGFETELKFPHWLAKARRDGAEIDIVFSSANGLLPVDGQWFRHAIRARLLGIAVELCPVEESIAQRAFVMERERYDGADVMHLIRLYGRELDWDRLLARFGGHSAVLLSHLVLYGFIYPGARDSIPRWVMRLLLRRLESELAAPPPADEICRGGLLSRAQYLFDFARWQYRDARLPPHGNLRTEDLRTWTDAIAEDQPAEIPRQSGEQRVPRQALRRARRKESASKRRPAVAKDSGKESWARPEDYSGGGFRPRLNSRNHRCVGGNPLARS